jgi:hypothetical protein
MWMMSVNAMEAFKPPCGSQTKSKLWANKITVGDYKIPIYRMQGSLHICPIVLSSQCSQNLATARAALQKVPAHVDAAELHCKLGHAHLQCCIRTAKKSIGGLKPVSISDFNPPGSLQCMPCSMCMHAPSVGLHSLSTGTPHPTQPCKLLSVNTIGPLSVCSLHGEKYIFHVSCAYSSHIAVHVCKKKSKFVISWIGAGK